MDDVFYLSLVNRSNLEPFLVTPVSPEEVEALYIVDLQTLKKGMAVYGGLFESPWTLRHRINRVNVTLEELASQGIADFGEKLKEEQRDSFVLLSHMDPRQPSPKMLATLETGAKITRAQ